MEGYSDPVSPVRRVAMHGQPQDRAVSPVNVWVVLCLVRTPSPYGFLPLSQGGDVHRITPAAKLEDRGGLSESQ